MSRWTCTLELGLSLVNRVCFFHADVEYLLFDPRLRVVASASTQRLGPLVRGFEPDGANTCDAWAICENPLRVLDGGSESTYRISDDENDLTIADARGRRFVSAYFYRNTIRLYR